MLIAKRGLLVIGIQLVKGTKLGVRLQDSGKGKEAVDGVTVKGDLGLRRVDLEAISSVKESFSEKSILKLSSAFPSLYCWLKSATCSLA